MAQQGNNGTNHAEKREGKKKETSDSSCAIRHNARRESEGTETKTSPTTSGGKNTWKFEKKGVASPRRGR